MRLSKFALGPTGIRSSLVYNAFAMQQGSADQLDLAESQRAMRVNFLAATQLTALVAPAMRASGTGSLLFTGGGAALRSLRGPVESLRGQGGVAHVGPHLGRGPCRDWGPR